MIAAIFCLIGHTSIRNQKGCKAFFFRTPFIDPWSYLVFLVDTGTRTINRHSSTSVVNSALKNANIYYLGMKFKVSSPGLWDGINPCACKKRRGRRHQSGAKASYRGACPNTRLRSEQKSASV